MSRCHGLPSSTLMMPMNLALDIACGVLEGLAVLVHVCLAQVAQRAVALEVEHLLDLLQPLGEVRHERPDALPDELRGDAGQDARQGERKTGRNHGTFEQTSSR